MASLSSVAVPRSVNGSPSCRSMGGSPSTISTASAKDNAGGIGIAEFFGGKNILVIGGTGFLGKVLMEKILRTDLGIGKIYVLIKAKDTEAALKRLQNEVVDTELFRCLQEIHGKDYQSFVASKLVPVVGNIREPSLGIATELANEITKEVDIIINMAANTTFDERYDVAIDTNTLGPLRMISFAHRFRRLKLFLHVSTAYVNGERQGVVLEKPLHLGETRASDSSEHKTDVLDIEAEIKLAFDSRRQSENPSSFHKEMKDLGIKRAKLHGWQDTYVFTKAMGEMVINTMRGDIPVVTIRPSIVESTLREPFPGWIQGKRMMDPFILYYGKGLLNHFLAAPDCVLDVVPVDMVVNAMMAAMAKHGGAAGTATAAPGAHVYHVTSSTVNPLLVSDQLRFIYQHFSKSPLMDDASGRPILVQPACTVGSVPEFVGYMYLKSNDAPPLEEGNGEAAGMSPSSRRASTSSRRLRGKSMEEQIVHLSAIYEPYNFYRAWFDCANTEALFAEMSAPEKKRFSFDMRSVDWMEYMINVHIPGLRKHVLKEGQQQRRRRHERSLL